MKKTINKTIILNILLVLSLLSSLFVGGWTFYVLNMLTLGFATYMVWVAKCNDLSRKNLWMTTLIIMVNYLVISLFMPLFETLFSEEIRSFLLSGNIFLISNIYLFFLTINLFIENKSLIRSTRFLMDFFTVASIGLVFGMSLLSVAGKGSLLNLIVFLKPYLFVFPNFFSLLLISVLFYAQVYNAASKDIQILSRGVALFLATQGLAFYLSISHAISLEITSWLLTYAMYFFALATQYEGVPIAFQGKIYTKYQKYIPRIVFFGINLVLLMYFKNYYAVLFVLAMIVFSTIGDWILHESSEESHLIMKEEDITVTLDEKLQSQNQELLKANEMLRLKTVQDPLTKLYNRRAYIHYLDSLMSVEGTSFSIITLSLDKFRHINSTYGHAIADGVLIEVAHRINSSFKNNTMTFRNGSDEYAIIFKDESSIHQMKKYGQTLLHAIEHPIVLENYSLQIIASMSIVMYPDFAENRTQVMQYANYAMRIAKKQVSGKIVFFDKYLMETLQRSTRLEQALKNLDYGKEVELMYTPRFGMPYRNLTGIECNALWNHPKKGIIPSSELQNAIDHSSMMEDYTSWFLSHTLQTIKEWNETYQLDLPMSIHISFRQFNSNSFLPLLKDLITMQGIKPNWIDIRIDEASIMNIFEMNQDKLEEINAMGVQITMENFGMGYSSLTKIKSLNINTLKISPEIIQELDSHKNQSIVKAILMMAKGLDINVVTGGVSNEFQEKILSDLGCTYFQGEYLGRATQSSVFESLYIQPYVGRLAQ